MALKKTLSIMFLLLAMFYNDSVQGRPNSTTLIGSGVKVSALQEEHDLATGIAHHRITIGGSGHNLVLNMPALHLTETSNGILTLTLMIACALPNNITVSVPGNDMLQFFGESNLAPNWRNRALTLEEQQRVSACIFVHASADGLAGTALMRGNEYFFHTDDTDKMAFPIQEGAFFGNYFTPIGSPILWFACRGDGQILVPSATGLSSRECAKPKQDQPTLTICGMTFAGDCLNICKLHHDFYTHCHFHSETGSESQFEEIITTYVLK